MADSKSAAAPVASATPASVAAPAPAADGSATAAAAAKKKKKKKKKTGGGGGGGGGGDAKSAISDSAAAAELASGFPALAIHEFFKGTAAKLQCSEKKGRHVLAVRAVKAGEVVLETPPYAAVASDPFVDKVCHRCFKRPEATETAGAVLYVCAGCKHARFCSTACMNSFKHIHELECKSLSRFGELELEGDTTALRCVLRMMYLAAAEKRYTEAKSFKDKEKLRVWKPKPGVTIADVRGLIHHDHRFSNDHKNAFRDACTRMEEIIAPDAWMSVDAALQMILQIQVNAHHITDSNKQRVGLGLYPASSFLNHSCAPNVVYHFEAPHAVMQCRAIVDIPAGAEIVYSYIDLYQPPKIRRHRLQQTYFIQHCDCSRCSKPISTSHDRFLNGFLCPACGDTERGVLKLWEHNSVDDAAIEAALEAESVDATDAKADAKDAKAPAASTGGVNSPVSCANCGDSSVKVIDCYRAQRHVQNQFELYHRQLYINDDYASARIAFEKKLLPPAATVTTAAAAATNSAAGGATATAAADAKSSAAAAARTGGRLLHPLHTSIFNVHLALINICRAMDDYEAQRSYCQRVIETLTKCFGADPHPEVADAYLSLGESCIGMATKIVVDSKTAETLLDDREQLIKAGAEAFQKCASIRAIALGEHNTDTKLARELITRFSPKKAAAGGGRKKK